MAQRPETPRLGIQRSLIAPGVSPTMPQAPAPPSDGTATRIMQLLQAATGTARATAQFAAVHEKMQEMQDTQDIIESKARGEGIPKQLRTFGVHNAVWRNEAAKVLETLDPRTLERAPNEDDTALLHRWISEHTPAGAPDVYKAAMLDGARSKFSRYKIEETRLAKAREYNSLRELNRRTAYGGTPEDMQKNLDISTPFGDAQGVSREAQRKDYLTGFLAAANEGRIDHIKSMEKFMAPDEFKRLTKRATDVYQQQQFSAAHPEYEAHIANGADFDAILLDIDGRTDDGHFSDEQATRLKGYLRSVAKNHFSAQYWPDYWDGVSTPESRQEDLRKAHKQGILSPQEVNTWNAKTKEADKFAGQKADLEKFLTGELKGVPGPEFEEALKSLAGMDYKYIDIRPLNEQGTRWGYIGVFPQHRAAWAQLQAELVEDGVHPDVSKQIARNMESTNPNAENRLADMATATEDYLAYTPEQQSTIKKRAGQEARMRFSAIDNIIREGGNPVEQIARIASYKIPAVTDEQAMSAMLTKTNDPNATPPESPLTEANKILRKRVPEIMRNLTDKWYSAPKIDTVPPDMPNAFIEGSTDEYRTQLSVLGHDGAVARGTVVGIYDSWNIAQPVPWGDRLTWVRDAPPIIKLVGDEFVMIADIGANITKDLKVAGFKDKHIRGVLQNDYRIAFDQPDNRFKLVHKITGKELERVREGRLIPFRTRGGLAIPKRKTRKPVIHPRRFGATAGAANAPTTPAELRAFINE